MTRQLQVHILERFMSDKEMASLYEEYKDHKLTRGRREVTARDFKILDDYLSNTPARVIAKKHGVSPFSIATSVRVAAVAKLEKTR